jgi:hypothetical protein
MPGGSDLDGLSRIISRLGLQEGRAAETRGELELELQRLLERPHDGVRDRSDRGDIPQPDEPPARGGDGVAQPWDDIDGQPQVPPARIAERPAPHAIVTPDGIDLVDVPAQTRTEHGDRLLVPAWKDPFAAAYDALKLPGQRLVLGVRGDLADWPVAVAGDFYQPGIGKIGPRGDWEDIDLDLVAVDGYSTAIVGPVRTLHGKGRIARLGLYDLLIESSDSYGLRSQHEIPGGQFLVVGCGVRPDPARTVIGGGMHVDDPFDSVYIAEARRALTRDGAPVETMFHGVGYIKTWGHFCAERLHDSPWGGRSMLQLRPDNAAGLRTAPPTGGILIRDVDVEQRTPDGIGDGGGAIQLWSGYGGPTLVEDVNIRNDRRADAGCLNFSFQPPESGNHLLTGGYTHGIVTLRNVALRNPAGARSPLAATAVRDLRFAGTNIFAGNGEHPDVTLNALTPMQWGATPNGRVRFATALARQVEQRGIWTYHSGTLLELTLAQLDAMTIGLAERRR